MHARQGTGACAVRIRRTHGQQLRTQSPCERALAGPAGSVKQVRVRRPAPGSERRAEHGARVRVMVELSQHPALIVVAR